MSATLDIFDLLDALEEAFPGKEIMVYLRHGDLAIRLRWIDGEIKTLLTIYNRGFFNSYSGLVRDAVVAEIGTRLQDMRNA